MLSMTISPKSRLCACLMLAAVLGACSKQEEAAPAATTPAAANQPAATPAATPPAPAVAATVQAMGADQLRDAASQALRENRMYAPAGDNAMEYYLALRDKLPDDAAVSSALTDLMPYTLIAAEQAVAREQFEEAQRLVALIEKADKTAPALPRIRQSITTSQQAVAQRSEAEANRAKADAEARVQAQAQQQVQQQAAEADAARRLAEQQEAARQAAAREAEQQREAAARQAAAQQQAAPAAQAAAPAQRSLRPISMPSPRYPPDALRAGTSGEVLVEFTVGTDGAVTDARVLRANPARTFDREALNAVRRWRFEPVDAPVTTRRTVAFNPGG
ncbi:energy transducer TonB [Pseudoxanthomonas daejeonensis]|uniref:energy transducer TonB n=1 Tax=Pseudoxanthomonas daejeonensis TaxID=266062 RepID=UPI001F5484FB|nr:energy transducer TonB [Pseudoxanthomonas daejeonensis]UNK58757.1 energy transducer TonB [Pseudoxanthomonas daejeonensis]